MPVQAHTLDDYVEAFESAYQAHGAADLRKYLPPNDDPLHQSVLRELIRIDLEFGWESNRPRSLEEYRSDFPALFDDPDSLQEIAYEEFRLRRRAGQAPSPQEYARRYGVQIDGWPASPADQASDPASVCLENVARTYRAFSLAPLAPSAAFSEPELSASINLDNWQPPAGTEGELIRLFRDLHLADQRAAGQLADGLCNFPSVGEEYLGFRLIGELGRGAFGRVFLARQAALASRPVALKVAPDVGPESQTLAQLQHTHIVPVYSVHRSGSLQAVCMPYCGAVTLADIIRDFHTQTERPREGLELLRLLSIKPRAAGVAVPDGPSPAVRNDLARLRFAEAALWLGARLAGGLHHAHERGILHRDVKPANVLVTDEGLPMLLDFNVAEDLKQRGASAALVGGTLPYMAPELLAAFKGEDRKIDARSDVYSLGIVLFELLTGRFPFAPVRLPADTGDGPGLETILVRMLDERRSGPPCPRKFDPEISPATAAIVRHCLEADPARRYPSARALQEDLERQLASQPLRHAPEPSSRERAAKWIRRRPRLGVKLSGAAACVVFFLAVTLILNARAIERNNSIEAYAIEQTNSAHQTFADFLPDYREAEFLLSRGGSAAQRHEGESLARRALARYGVLNDDDWQESPAISFLPSEKREDVQVRAAELLLLLASEISASSGSDRNRDNAEALRFNQLAKGCFTADDVPDFVQEQRARILGLGTTPPKKGASRAQTDPRKIESVRNITIQARDLTWQEHFTDAIELLESAVQREPGHFKAQFLLSRCYFGLGQYHRAVSCCTACTALLPDFHGPYVNRGLAYLQLRDWKAAKADFDRVIKLKPDRAEAYLDRAIAREKLDDFKGAEADLSVALDKGIPFTRVFLFRSRIREALGNKTGADSDYKEGVRRKPKDDDELSWIARGFARMKNQPDKALADFDKALAINPRSRIALRNKAHVLGEIQNKQAEARPMLERVLELSPDDVEALAGLAVVLARLNEPKLARQRIEAALLRDTSGRVHYQAASAYALTSRSHAPDAETAIMHLREALLNHFGADFIHRDPDLEPLKDRLAFKQLVRLAGLLRQFPVGPK